jgi:hypothetical protein
MYRKCPRRPACHVPLTILNVQRHRSSQLLQQAGQVCFDPLVTHLTPASMIHHAWPVLAWQVALRIINGVPHLTSSTAGCRLGRVTGQNLPFLLDS